VLSAQCLNKVFAVRACHSEVRSSFVSLRGGPQSLVRFRRVEKGLDKCFTVLAREGHFLMFLYGTAGSFDGTVDHKLGD